MNKQYVEILKELILLGVEKSSSALNFMLMSSIELSVPAIQWLPNANISKVYDELSEWGFNELALVNMKIMGELSGSAQLVFNDVDAQKIVSSMVEKIDDAEMMTAMVEDSLKEIGNILINGLIGTLGNELKINIVCNLPTYRKDNIGRMVIVERDVSLVFCKVKFLIKAMNISGNFILTFEVDRLKALYELLEVYNRKET